MDGEVVFGKFKDLRYEADRANSKVAVAEADFFVKDF